MNTDTTQLEDKIVELPTKLAALGGAKRMLLIAGDVDEPAAQRLVGEYLDLKHPAGSWSNLEVTISGQARSGCHDYLSGDPAHEPTSWTPVAVTYDLI